MSAQPIDIEKLIAPIPGAKACGESAKYEPEYETLEAEVARESGITPQPVDWGSVQRNAQAILEGKSKDLLIAVYYTYAAFDKRGYAGLLAGLKVCRALVQTFWEDLYPEKKRMRGRIAALEWLAGKLERALEQSRPATDEGPVVTEAATVLEELAKLLEEKLGRDAPDTAKVQRKLRDYARESEKPPQAAAAAAAAPGAAVPQGAIQVATEADVPKALRQGQTILRSVAAFIRAQKLEDPRSYRLTRVGAWLLIDQLPMQQNGVTQLAAPPAAVVQKYNGYIAEQKFAALIPEVEESFSKSPFWLDAHRFTAIALENLGANYVQAKQVVISELAAFLRRLPELVDYKFTDGTPYANEQTRLWLDQEVLAASEGGGGAAATPGEAPVHAPWLAAQREAKQLAVKGKSNEALALFQDGYAQSKSQRERFGWSLAQARFCFDAGMLQAALPQLEHLEQQVARFALEEWEPELSLEVARVLLLCYAQTAEKNKKMKDVLAPKAEQLFARLSRLDLNAALKVDMKAFQ
jgi:type VI secretion system protein VasJ